MGNAERDATIARLHAQGLSNRAIAPQVGLTPMHVGREVKRLAHAAAEALLTPEVDEDAEERRELAELIEELYTPDGRPNRLTLFRLRFGYVELTAEQGRRVAAARDLDDRLMSPEERERRRWQFAGPRMRDERDGTFTPVVEGRAWHPGCGRWTWTWASGDASGGAEAYRAFARWDSPADAMADAEAWVQRRWHGDPERLAATGPAVGER